MYCSENKRLINRKCNTDRPLWENDYLLATPCMKEGRRHSNWPFWGRPIKTRIIWKATKLELGFNWLLQHTHTHTHTHSRSPPRPHRNSPAPSARRADAAVSTLKASLGARASLGLFSSALLMHSHHDDGTHTHTQTHTHTHHTHRRTHKLDGDTRRGCRLRWAVSPLLILMLLEYLG